MSGTNQKTMAEVKEQIIDFLTEQMQINHEALATYESDNLLPPTTSDEVRRMRESEAIKLRDRITQLSSYVSFIKRAFPTKTTKHEPASRTASTTRKVYKKRASQKD